MLPFLNTSEPACPFCKADLSPYYKVASQPIIEWLCTNPECFQDKMMRFKVGIIKDTKHISYIFFMLEDLYVEINYDNNYTKIHKLVSCMLLDTVKINHVMNVDLSNEQALGIKLKSLLVFS